MIADDDVNHRFEELRHVLKQAMLRSGVLGTLRAQLRVSALETLKGTQADGALRAALGIHQPPTDEHSPEHLALLLVYDFLHHFPTLKRSAGVFAEESGLGDARGAERSYHDAKQLADEIGVGGTSYTPHDHVVEPLLVRAVRQLQSGERQQESKPSQQQQQQQSQQQVAPKRQEQQVNAAAEPTQQQQQPEQQRTEPVKQQQPQQQAQQVAAAAISAKDLFTAAMTSPSSAVEGALISKQLKDTVLEPSKIKKLDDESKAAGDWEEVQELEPLPSGANTAGNNVVQISAAAASSSSSSSRLATAPASISLATPSATAAATRNNNNTAAALIDDLLPPNVHDHHFSGGPLPPMTGSSLPLHSHQLAPLAPLDTGSSSSAAAAAAKKPAKKKKKKKTAAAATAGGALATTASSGSLGGGGDHSDGDEHEDEDDQNNTSLASAASGGGGGGAPVITQPHQEVQLASPPPAATTAIAAAEPVYEDEFEDDDTF